MVDNVILIPRSGWRTRRALAALASVLVPAFSLAPLSLAPYVGASARAQQAAMPQQQLTAPQQLPDKFRITAQEKAACTSDAIRFCMHTYPDEDQLLACMKQNHDALTATCRVAFDAGVRRRRL